MLMKWEIRPKYPSFDNKYHIKLTFENNKKARYKIEKIIFNFIDLNLVESKDINYIINEPWFNITNRRFTHSFSFNLLKDIVYPHRFLIQLQVRKFINGKWTLPKLIEWAPKIFQLSATSTYNAFISRSIKKSEKFIPYSISSMIALWGFNLHTIGIQPLIKNLSDEDLLDAIRDEIKRADIVFAIATKRDQLLNTIEWKTFEWLQSETAIAYVLNKQIIVFVEEGVNLSGLASKLVVIPFNSNNLEVLNRFFDQYMIKIRNNINKRRNSEFLYNLIKIGGITGGLYLFGRFVYELGKESLSNSKK